LPETQSAIEDGFAGVIHGEGFFEKTGSKLMAASMQTALGAHNWLEDQKDSPKDQKIGGKSLLCRNSYDQSHITKDIVRCSWLR
jgi:hypothetical protein